MNSYRSLIESVLDPVGVSGRDTIYICPKCDDKSGHLYVDYDHNMFHCFKCNYKGRSLSKLVKELGLDISFDYEDIDQPNRNIMLDEVINPKSKETTVLDYSINLKDLTEFYYNNSTVLSSVGRAYLNNRGVTDSMIDFYHIREGIDKSGVKFNINGKVYNGINYKNRVMIPSINKEGLISYFVARDYIGLSKQKYMNPPKELSYASEDVWCLDLVVSDNVIICEGVFTALSINSRLGKHIAVSTYGKDIAMKSSNLSNIIGTSQFDKLLNRDFVTYYMFYDKDAVEEMYNCAERLYNNKKEVKCILIPYDNYGKHADAADLSDNELLECILNAKEFNYIDKALIGLN